MNDKLKNFTLSLPKIFGNKKSLKVVTVLGIAGILLIVASEWFFGENSGDFESKTEEISVNKYVKMLEDKTEKMLLSVDGAGKSKIMITAEASATQQYAVDESISNDTQQNKEENSDKKEIQTEIVMIEGESGRKEALVVRVVEPEIRGVLVLCEGADNPEVNEKITQAVKTLLGISSNKICVIKLK